MMRRAHLSLTLLAAFLSRLVLAQQADCGANASTSRRLQQGKGGGESGLQAKAKGMGFSGASTLGAVALQHELENCTAFDADASSNRLWLNPNHESNADGRQSFPISLGMRIFSGSTEIKYQEAKSAMIVRFEAAIITEWHDPRLANAACKHVMYQMLNTEDVGNDDFGEWPVTRSEFRRMYYMPRIKMRMGEATTTEFDIGITDDGHVTQVERVTITAEQHREGWGDYFYFPSDSHNASIVFEMTPGADLTQSCRIDPCVAQEYQSPGLPSGLNMMSNASLAEYDEHVLPSSGEWRTIGVDLAVRHNACTMRLVIRREQVGYMSRSFVLDCFVVIAGMTSLFLDPTIPPLLGGRCSLLILAMLITMNRFSQRALTAREEPTPPDHPRRECPLPPSMLALRRPRRRVHQRAHTRRLLRHLHLLYAPPRPTGHRNRAHPRPRRPAAPGTCSRPRTAGAPLHRPHSEHATLR